MWLEITKETNQRNYEQSSEIHCEQLKLRTDFQKCTTATDHQIGTVHYFYTKITFDDSHLLQLMPNVERDKT